MIASSSRLTLGTARQATTLRPRCREAARRATGRPSPSGVMPHIAAHTRAVASLPPPSKQKQKAKDRYNFNTSMSFSAEPDPDHVNYRRVTATELANRKEPPTRVKMLVRDFIDDSLYNPNYGYFPRNATIFTPPERGFDFSKFRDTPAFQEAVAERYEAEYGELVQGGLGRQVWHTPTELFKPHYARSLTTAILSSYKLNHYPDQPLTIYEVGAGNGSFMSDSLAFIRDTHPDIFARMKYRIIEISASLADIQRKRAEKEGFRDVVEVINEDFFRWQGPKSHSPSGSSSKSARGTRGGAENTEGEGCYVVALEVFDNFAHDMIRYDIRTLTPLQAIVSVDSMGDFSLLYEPLTDPLLKRVLSYRRLLPPSPATIPPLPSSSILRQMYASLPFAPNLSSPDFIPTKAVSFLERLRDKLPGHRLLVADFAELPDTVEGRNGPVVQTRLGKDMVPCETILVKQGYFDIFFPTDFELLRDTYSLIMNSPSSTFSELVSPRFSSSLLSSSSSTSIFASSPSSSSSSSNSSSSKSPSNTTSHTSPLTRLTSTASPNSGLAHFFTPSLSSSTSTSTGVRGFRRRKVEIYSHASFLEKYGGEEVIGPTRVGDGTSVMLGMYGNGRVMF